MENPLTITAGNRPFHPGMTPAWFDRAAHRAIMAGKTARQIAPGRWVVTSATTPGLSYLATAYECSCPGHRAYGRCCCRGLVCLEEWLLKQARTTDTRPAA